MAYLPQLDVPYTTLAGVTLLFCLAGVAAAWRKRKALGKWGMTLLMGAGLALALAAGGLRVVWPSEEKVQVMVDLSASTRGAEYRQTGQLRKKVEKLLGGQPYELIGFGEARQKLNWEQPLREMAGVKTIFAPESGRPVLLFSDGQFDLPQVLPPTWVVIDPGLAKADDARVICANRERGGEVAVVEGGGGGRVGPGGVALPAGRTRVTLEEGVTRIAVGGKDLWPENDQLDLPAVQPGKLQRWLVGFTAKGWQTKDGAQLPETAGELAQVGVLALRAGEIALLTRGQQNAIATYVREMGGTLLLIGGDEQWMELRNNQLGAMSPLAVDPPESKQEWVVLMDASGSMAQREGSQSKWELALIAADAMVRLLPEEDGLRVGSFAAQPRWWVNQKVAEVAANGVRPPAGLVAHGPTNLQTALQAVLALPPTAARHLLLLSDAETELENLPGLAQSLVEGKTRVSVLLLADGRGKQQLRQLAAMTGGSVAQELRPGFWYQAARKLAVASSASTLQKNKITVQFQQPRTWQREVAQWNKAWLKSGAVLNAAAMGDGQKEPLGANWQVGLGRVGSFALELQEDELEVLAGELARRPGGLLGQVEWINGEEDVQVKLSLNQPVAEEMAVAVNLLPSGKKIVLRQRDAMHWEGKMAYPAEAQVAVVQSGNQVWDRRMIGGRYPVEFAKIGINWKNLEELAQRSGGKMVEAGEEGEIDFHQARLMTNLGWALGGLAAMILGWVAWGIRQRG